LDIFEITTSKNELAKESINKEFRIFRSFQVDAKDIKCVVQYSEKHESMFLTIGVFA
jgi:hypothetical protein